MAKIDILDKAGKKTGDFDFEVKSNLREDIFKKAVFAERSWFKESYGAFERAGKRATISLSKRRKAFRTTYGTGGTRVPKKVMWKRGTQMRFVGAFAPGTVGGRRAHPPKANKIVAKSMNNKEWIKAVVTGLNASLDGSKVLDNGQKVPKSYPFILNDDIDSLEKTKDVIDCFTKLGLEEEINRTSTRSIRAGKGKMRNRKYVLKRGPLVVCDSSESKLLISSRNLLGFDSIISDELLASDFGMSEKPGRIVLFTQKAALKFKEVVN